MDISSSESGAAAGDPQSAETGKSAGLPSEETSGEIAHSNEDHDLPSSGNPEVNKVLAYGPAQRDVEVPEIKVHQTPEGSSAPEVKADKTIDLASKKDRSAGSALVPFAGTAKASAADTPPDETHAPRASRFELLRSRGMQAALLAAFAGIGWAVAGSMFSDHPVTGAPRPSAAALPPAIDPPRQMALASDNGETRRLADEVRLLKKELDGLRSSLAQNQAPEEMRGLKKSIDAIRNSLEGTKAEMNASLAQLSAKLDKAQHDPAKLREISDRLDRVEHAGPLTTASIAPPQQEPAPKLASSPLPAAKAQAPLQPQSAAAKPSPMQTAVAVAAPAPDKPQIIANWVVRDVYDGIALVEGPHGSVEVIEGETIPGAGTVKSIERRGSGWIVVTSRGLVDSARN